MRQHWLLMCYSMSLTLASSTDRVLVLVAIIFAPFFLFGHLVAKVWGKRAGVAAVVVALALRTVCVHQAHAQVPTYENMPGIAPPGAHAALTKRALDAGLHVLCEKPLVTRAEDARMVAAEAARAGRIVHTVHNWLKAPICLKLSWLVAEGAIGAVRSVSWRTLRTQPSVVAGPIGVANWRRLPRACGPR